MSKRFKISGFDDGGIEMAVSETGQDGKVAVRHYAYPADRCSKHCSVCEGLDHHWMADCDDETGDPVMVCKHCEAVREMTDDDFE